MTTMSWASQSTNDMNDEVFFKKMSGQFNVDNAEGIVECFVAAIGNKDSVGDIILPGAFDGSLKRRKPRVVWGHNWNEPIGKVLDIYEVGPRDPRLPVKMREAGVGGVYAKVQFNMKSDRGRQAFMDVSFFGEEQEWSIGYKTLESDFDPIRKANLLKEVELYEVSPVLHGANQLTSTISIKADESLDVKNTIYMEGPSDSDENPATGRAGELARALAKMLGGAVRLRMVQPTMITFDHVPEGAAEPRMLRVDWQHRGDQFMFGIPQMVGKPNADNESPREDVAAHTAYPVTNRQRAFYEAIENVSEQFGRFNQGVGADGAHYVEKSPFEKEGLVCSNCLFYEGARACEVVTGDIAPGGICKLWQIPEPLIVEEGAKKAALATECKCGGGCGGSCGRQPGMPRIPVIAIELAEDDDDIDEVLEEARHTQQSALARAISREVNAPVMLRNASPNTVVFEVMSANGIQTMRASWHAERGQVMVGRPEPVIAQTVYMPVEGNGGQVYKDANDSQSVKAPRPSSAQIGRAADIASGATSRVPTGSNLAPDVLPQERVTGDVLRGYGPRRGNLERLLRYWRPIMRREGGFRRCRVILADHPELYPLNNICAWLHHETTGLWPNEGCHHPGMKNCRRKLRGVTRGSLWNDREWNSRLNNRFGRGKSIEDGGWVYADDDERDVGDFDELMRDAGHELVRFCKEEPDFVNYMSDEKNWFVEGDMDDGSIGEHAIMGMGLSDGGGCGCGCGKSDDPDISLKELIDTLELKVGRAINGRSLEKLQQAIVLLQEIVASTGAEPVLVKTDVVPTVDGVTVSAPVENLFEIRNVIDPILSRYGVTAQVSEKGISIDRPEKRYLRFTQDIKSALAENGFAQ